MVSPCPPRTNAVISFTETLNSSARKWRNLALSKMPAIPTTLLWGKPENCLNAQTIASKGLVIHITKAFGAFSFIPSPTDFITLRLIPKRSSLLMPGFLGTPAVTIQTSQPLIWE